MTNRNQKNELIDLALNGSKEALEELLLTVQDSVFNLSLRMLGTRADAEDASQEIMIRIITNLSTFRRECDFSTWVYRISMNNLLNYKKSMFSRYPVSFDFYGNDIKNGTCLDSIDRTAGVDRDILTEELKMSCTNVMLQCLDPQSRCIFILGTMFHFDSKIAGEILGMTAENFRKKLSRTRKKMSDFLASYCGLSDAGICSCRSRVDYAIEQHRLNPGRLEYKELELLDIDTLAGCKKEMEVLDDLSLAFDNLPNYKSPQSVRSYIENILNSTHIETIMQYR